MSFGEGDLHEKLAAAEERADMYRRQLGGMTAAHSRRKRELDEARTEIAELRGWVSQLEAELGKTCTMEMTYHGEPCSDWTCSRCGKTHVAHNAAKLGEFCPRCGARVECVCHGKPSARPSGTRPEGEGSELWVRGYGNSMTASAAAAGVARRVGFPGHVAKTAGAAPRPE